MKNLILGAGVTGLACGIKTGAPIYEMTSHAGGICQDYEKDGFKFSNGGPHWVFGKDKGLEYIKSLVEIKEYQRKAGVYYNHTFPYPFQSFAQKDIYLKCTSKVFYTMKTRMYSDFGTELCNMFFNPFNEKYTAGLYDDVCAQDAYKSPKTGTGWVSTFCDPVKGLSDLVSKMASQCTIHYDKKAFFIDINKKTVSFTDGTEEAYDRLISTIPLDQCLRISGKMGISLPFTSVLVINIGAEPGHSTPEEHWLYIPFCKSGFHRVAFYTNVDPTKAPIGKVGLSVEIAFHNKDLKDLKVNEISFQVCQELERWGWIKNPTTICIDWVPCAYTWLYNKDDAQRGIDWLAQHDIISAGRYATWKFCGITQSIMMGMEVEI